jgi:catechol 2,3-dioxygenase-like lactoylglutathione lyase family enzyme
VSSGIEHLFAGVPVADYAAGRAWWERFLGREPDMLPHDNEAAWQLNDSAWIYVVRDAERAGRGLVTLLVDDLDGWLAGLEERGVAPGPVETIAEGRVRRSLLRDPDGNGVTLGQPT